METYTLFKTPGSSSSHHTTSAASLDTSSRSRYFSTYTWSNNLVKVDGTPADALGMMRDVLNKLWENRVPGPQLFRLASEFNSELGEGSQFKVTAACTDFETKLQSTIRSSGILNIRPALADLRTCVVKRAHLHPKSEIRRRYEARGSRENRDVVEEVQMQLHSAKTEIDKLCNVAYRKHANIVKLRGWGLCLDTFEGLTSLGTRIPLLVLERADCDLGQFLISHEYDNVTYDDLRHICWDIGRGLGALHFGNVTHGDMKPENILLFRTPASSPKWVAKLCDFGNAVTKPILENQEDSQEPGVTNPTLFNYWGTGGWSPPEVIRQDHQDVGILNFEQLKQCDIYVYGLVIWRIFESRENRDRWNQEGPIAEGDILPYQTDDRAYIEASEAVRSSSKVPSVSNKDQDTDLRRILLVLRGALQGEARFRYPRPWKYFNTITYPLIPLFDESPGRDDDGIFEGWMRSYIIPFGALQSRKIIDGAKILGSFAQKTTASLQDMTVSWFSVFSKRVDRLQRVELLGSSIYGKLGLTWRLESLGVLQHEGRPCYDLQDFKDMFFDGSLAPKSQKIDFWSADIDLNAYAILRSRFKICCWQASLGSKCNALSYFLSLDASSSLSRPHLYDVATSFPTSISTLAWLLRGEIGKSELRQLMESSSLSARFWQYAFDILEIWNTGECFQLFVEMGCYVGQAVEVTIGEDGYRSLNRTTQSLLRKFLEMAPRNSDMLSCCAAIIRNIPKVLAEASTAHNDRVFFLTGQLLDQSVLDNSIQPFAEAMNITTLLHEAVAGKCYQAV